MIENNQKNNDISSKVEKNSTLRVSSPLWMGFKSSLGQIRTGS